MKNLILQDSFLDVLFGNGASISLFIIFLVSFILGTLLMYHQVSLVLRGEFRLKERLQCIVFGIIFSLAIMIVMSMAFIFAANTPEFWVNSTTPAPNIDPIYLIFPFIICLLYISIYPLIDFLFIALSEESDEGMTPFHKLIGEKIIKKSRSKIFRIILAIGFYFLVFVLPPLLLSLMGLPFIMIWISWMLIYPLMILTFYGSKGYIAGITIFYYHIPDMRRSIFLGFEDGKRTMKEFTKNPAPRIVFGLMIFVYVWTWISAIQTIAFYFTGALAISPYSYAGMVFVTLLFGIIGYFTRFWSRKIKFSPIHIYFAAYLIAAVGINVFVNFLIVNAEKLSDTFSGWNFTNVIVPNYLMFAWAAAIEEIILLTFITYYFLSKRSDYSQNLKLSLITQCGQTFDPIPLFNFIKSENPKIRTHAEETLTLMYERIPLKPDIKLNDMKYKNPLIDGISDPNPNSKRVCYKILLQLEKDLPNVILPWIIESLNSPNYDKSLPFAQSLLEADIDLLTKIPDIEIISLINDSEWRLKLIGLRILSRLIKINNNLISRLNLTKLLQEPDSQVQVEILKILAISSIKIPLDLINDKIDHSNREIRAAAIKNIKNIDIENIDFEIISKLKSLIKDPTSSVRASVFETFAKIGNFKRYNIPLLPFLNGLIDLNENVRDASILALEKYFNEQPDSLDINLIINKIDPNNNEILTSVISLLGRLWNRNPEKILTTLLIFIKFDNRDLKENISKIIVDKYETNPKLVIQNLIKVPDVSKFITKGIISSTLIRIAKNHPYDLIPLLIGYLDDDNNEVKFNAISSLEGLTDEFHDKINIKPIINLLQKDKNQQIKKEASKIITKLAIKDPTAIQPEISHILQSLNDQESTFKIAFSRSLLEIAKEAPEIIPISSIITFFSDQDSFIRESGAKILGYIGYKVPNDALNILIEKGLNDEDWIVRESSVSSLGKIVEHIDNKGLIINNLISLLDDDKAWVRRSVMNILSDLKGIEASDIPFEKVTKNLNNSDPKLREASAGILKIYGFHNIERIFENIISLLEDESEDVRNSMINSMVDIIQKIGLSEILSKLLKNLSDEGSLELQRSIAIILGRTTKYEDEKIKKRVISLLKIRCEMSQDPIICENLHKIRES